MKAPLPQDLPALLTPVERLTRSRSAISDLIGNEDHRHDSSHDDLGAEWGEAVIVEKSRRRGKNGNSWWPVFSSLAKTWWHRHPLNAVTHMAQPILASYAKRSPGKLIGAAALFGAVLVVARPWRLISVGALVAAAIRPSEISAFAMTMLSSFNSTLQNDKDQRVRDQRPE